jgi:hypothetical protein
MMKEYLSKKPLILRLLIVLIGFTIIIAILQILVNIYNPTITSPLVLLAIMLVFTVLITLMFTGLYQLSKNYFGKWLPRWSVWWDGILSGTLFLSFTIWLISMMFKGRLPNYIFPMVLLLLIYEGDYYSRQRLNSRQLLILRGLFFLILILGSIFIVIT